MTPDACPDYVPLLVRAADRSIDAAGGVVLEAHLATCAACREALAAQTFANAALASRAVVPASPAFRARVMAAIEPRESDTWLDVLDFRRWTWRIAPLTAAAAFAAYFVIGSVGRSTVETVSPPTTELSVSAAMLSDAVASDELMSLMLFASPDDSLATALKETVR